MQGRGERQVRGREKTVALPPDESGRYRSALARVDRKEKLLGAFLLVYVEVEIIKFGKKANVEKREVRAGTIACALEGWGEGGVRADVAE
jgi:hypothetical protein